MSMASISAVARREMRDSFTDWRMMLPVLILTFIVPLLIQIALVYLLDFLGEISTITRLVPFAVLLCGFLPASFSLISALESFVGEKERNTLESLLATPMSDNELYLGKLVAALLLPLFSAMLAMVTFIVLIILRASPDVYQNLTWLLMLEMFGLVAVKAVVMVSGAVIISSHTTTTRAANLLASFVLIPMATLVQLEALVIVAQNKFLTTLLASILLGLVMVAALLIRAGMYAFNREAILSREHAGFSFKRTRWAFGRFFSGFQPAGVPPERYEGDFSVARFYRQDLPALLRDYRRPILIVAACAIVGFFGGYQMQDIYKVRFVERAVEAMTAAPTVSVGMGLYYWIRNISSSFWGNLFAPFTFGVFSFFNPTVAASIIGYGAAAAADQSIPLGRYVVAYALPHGIVELPASILSGALGLRIGAALLRTPRGFSIGQNILWSLANFIKVWLFVLIPLYLIAGLLEGILTPIVVGALNGG